MVKNLLQQEQIKTTITLAKVSRCLAEKMITLGKKDTLSARRQAFSVLGDRDLVKLLFSDIAPRFAARAGGYTRIVRLGNRRGDNASLVILELTELKEKAKKEKKETAGKKETKKAADKKESAKTKKAEEAISSEVKNERDKEGKSFLGGLRKFFKQDKSE
ncbi:MAG: 50S ribosomal protein L17 [Candidatus Omnitrophica bacterium]|nr:50S ribosomal protein L17 [Candidatus Omnitrophota bacterium]